MTCAHQISASNFDFARCALHQEIDSYVCNRTRELIATINTRLAHAENILRVVRNERSQTTRDMRAKIKQLQRAISLISSKNTSAILELDAMIERLIVIYAVCELQVSDDNIEYATYREERAATHIKYDALMHRVAVTTIAKLQSYLTDKSQ